MKFVKTGDKHRENDYIEEEYYQEETTPPRHIPSYYNTAKKAKKNLKK